MTTTYPALAGGDDGGGPVPFHPHDAGDIEGVATFMKVKVSNLLAGTIDSKEIVISGGTDGVIRSDNYDPGVAGWAIFGDGSIEARNIQISAAAGSEVDWSHIQNVAVENADIVSLSADKITAGTLDADRIDVLGDVTLGGQLSAAGVRVGQKVNASQEPEWHGIGVEYDGSVTVTALMRDVNTGRTVFRVNHGGAAAISFDSDAATPLTIKGHVEASSGSLGDLDVGGALTMTTGGVLRTAASGERIEIANNFSDTLRWYDSGGGVFASLAPSGTSFNISAGVLSLAGTNGLELLGSDIIAQTDLLVNDAEFTAQGGSGDIAFTAYRRNATPSNDIAHFRSDAGGGATLHALVKVDGDLQNTNNSYGSISDERLKTDIETARSYLEDLRRIRITKHTLEATGQRNLGPIAQQVQDVFPGLVTESIDGYLGVKHSVFVPMAITAIQQLADDRDDNRAQIAELREDRDDLRRRIAALEAAA